MTDEPANIPPAKPCRSHVAKMSEQALQKIEPLPVAPSVEASEAKTSQQTRIDEVAEALLPAYQKASELRLSDKENKALLEPFADEQVEIRPHDGLLYIPHIHISDRLIRVLGAGEWAMVRRREWIEGNRIYAEYVMKVRGCFVGESVGAMDYHPSNARMNYSDALEGTRGECIRRIAAKDLGCGSQVWNPEYCRQWIARYAEQVKGKWQRKGQGTEQNQLTPALQSSAAKEPAKPKSPSKSMPESDEAARLRWIALLKPCGQAALDYCYEKGWLSGPGFNGPEDPGEPLEVLPLSAVPQTKRQASEILAEIAARMDGDLGPQKPPEAARPPSTSAPPAKDAGKAAMREPTPPQSEFMDAPAGYEPPGGWQGAGGGEDPNNDVETITGKLEFVSEKSGRSKKGPWTSYGLKIGDDWFNTFSKPLGELAHKDKGHTVRIQFRRGERGNDLVSIERA